MQGECPATTEAEVRVMPRKAQDDEQTPEPRREVMERVLALTAPKGTNPTHTLLSEFWPPEL